MLASVATAALAAQTLGSAPSTAALSTSATQLLRGTAARPDADGSIPDGTTVFDAQVPGVGNLSPSLLSAVRRAAANAAAQDGVRLLVNSGWRSPAYQAHLLREAVQTYGSPEEAARWVAAPDRSAHVSGDAIDIGPTAAATWLATNGPRYGLCRIYDNEPWHFELRQKASVLGCPPLYADPTQDPRLRP